MDFLGIGVPEVIVIIILALIFIGPRDLPKVAGRFAKFLRDLRMMSEGFRTEWQRELKAAGRIEGLKELKDELVSTKQTLQETSQELRSIGRDIQTSMTIDLDNLETEEEDTSATTSKTSVTKASSTLAVSANATETDDDSGDQGDEYVIGSSENEPSTSTSNETSSNETSSNETSSDNEIEIEAVETEVGEDVSAKALQESSQSAPPDLDELALQTPPPAEAEVVSAETSESPTLTSEKVNGDDQVIASPTTEKISPPPVSSTSPVGMGGGDIETHTIAPAEAASGPKTIQPPETTSTVVSAANVSTNDPPLHNYSGSAEEKSPLDDEVKVKATESATTEEAANSE